MLSSTRICWIALLYFCVLSFKFKEPVSKISLAVQKHYIGRSSLHNSQCTTQSLALQITPEQFQRGKSSSPAPTQPGTHEQHELDDLSLSS